LNHRVYFMSFIKPINKNQKVVTTAAKAVSSKEDKEEDGVLVTDEKLKEGMAMAKTALRAMGRGKGAKGVNKPIKVWLWAVYTNTSSATTAQAPVWQLLISNSAEASLLVDLYDEFKVTRAKIKYNVSLSTSANGLPIVCAYDPSNAGAYASIQAALPARYHKLTHLSGNFTQPAPHTKDGFWDFEFVMPKGPFAEPGGSTATGNWSDTSNYSTQDYGHVKWYINAATAGTTTVTGYVGLLTEFRMRS
jgi:hypothetical protein